MNDARPILTPWRLAALLLLPLSALHPGFNITLGDVVFFALIGALALRLRDAFPAVSLLSVATAGLVLVSVLWNALARNAGDVVEGAQAVLIFLVVIPLGWNVCRGLRFETLLKPVAVAAILHAAVAVLQVIQPDWRLPSQPVSALGEFGQRPAGLAGNPNGFGLMMTWMLPLVMWLALRARSAAAHYGWAVGAALVFVGGLLSFSKIGWVLVPASLGATLVLFRGRRTGFAVLGAVFVAVLFLFFGNLVEAFVDIVRFRFVHSESLGGRLVGIEAAWAELSRWILVGTGAATDAAYNADGVRIHNQFIGFAVQFGVPAAMLLVSIKLLLLTAGLRRLASEPVRLMLLAFVLSEFTMLVHPTYWTRAHSMPIILLMATLAADRRAREDEEGAT